MPFVMQQMQRVIDRFPDAEQALIRQVTALETNVESNQHICLGLARALIETCFKTIATQRGIDAGKGFKDQAVTALDCITHGLDGHTHAGKIDDAFAGLREGMSRLAEAMGQLSNVEGLRHGAAGDQPVLDVTRAQFFAAFADAACAFAYECHRAGPATRRMQLDDEPAFNEYLDYGWPVEIDGVPVEASAALFFADFEAYRERLGEWRSRSKDEEPMQEAI